MHTLHIAQGLKAENEGYTLSPVLLWSQKSLFLSITLVFLDLVLKRTIERPPKHWKFLTFLYSDDVEDNRAGDQVWEHCGPRMPRGKDVEVLTQGFDFVVFLQLTIACSKRVS